MGGIRSHSEVAVFARQLGLYLDSIHEWLNGYCPAYSTNHRGTPHFEQHYFEGVWYYYYLTGDERAREIGLRAADSIVFRQVLPEN